MQQGVCRGALPSKLLFRLQMCPPGRRPNSIETALGGASLGIFGGVFGRFFRHSCDHRRGFVSLYRFRATPGPERSLRVSSCLPLAYPAKHYAKV